MSNTQILALLLGISTIIMGILVAVFTCTHKVICPVLPLPSILPLPLGTLEIILGSILVRASTNKKLEW